jgi:hypothetical protein
VLKGSRGESRDRAPGGRRVKPSTDWDDMESVWSHLYTKELSNNESLFPLKIILCFSQRHRSIPEKIGACSSISLVQRTIL